jgi:hypothetical protein
LICSFDTHLTPNEANEGESERLGGPSAAAREREIKFKSNRSDRLRMGKGLPVSREGRTLNQEVVGSSPTGPTTVASELEFRLCTFVLLLLCSGLDVTPI